MARVFSARAVAIIIGLGLALGLGCPRRDINLAGKPCDDNDCVAGYRCHPEIKICAPDVAIDRATVGPGKSCVAEHAFIDCVESKQNCEAGCFTCQADGTWSECSKGCTDGSCDCVPETTLCDSSGNLVACDALGTVIGTPLSCEHGCNNSTSTNYCNECVPSTFGCIGTRLVTCDGTGHPVGTDVECAGGTICGGAGACDDTTKKCVTLAPAAVGTPCDEGGPPAQDGVFCNSECQGGSCVEGTPSCIDTNECTGPDTCDDATGCINDPVPVGTPCGDLCNNSCNDAGFCSGTPVVCDDGDICTNNNCIPNTGCEYPDNSAPCDDLDPCTKNDACSAGNCVGGPEPSCDDGLACTNDACITSVGCVHSAVDCSSTGSTCQAPNSCNPSGSDGNCDLAGNAINETNSCDDCTAGSGKCLSCAGGVCVNRVTCDGAASSTDCSHVGDCITDPVCIATDCTDLECIGSTPEHQACADSNAGSSYGPSAPCRSVSCSGDSRNHTDSVGTDCYSRNKILTITYSFVTTSSNGTPFNIWMRNIVDDSWGGGEHYDCTLTGVTGGTAYVFSFIEGDLDDKDRHSNNCGNYGSTPRVCWMAADGNTDSTDQYQPILLDAGLHNLTCSIDTDNDNDEMGFDGIIFTADLDFEPVRGNSSNGCGDSDATFSNGGCSGTNWGPNVPHVQGKCRDGVVVNEWGLCGDCPGAASVGCSICRGGMCQNTGTCNNTELCYANSDCLALGGTQCLDVQDDCQRVICNNATPEHFACADSATGGSWGAGQPCEAVNCSVDNSYNGTDAIGSDCMQGGNTAGSATITYTFNTQSTNGTLFNIWMLNNVDTDVGDTTPGKRYNCILSGVTGIGVFGFTFMQSDLDNRDRHGTGCGDYGNSPEYCWMAIDFDTDADNQYQPLPLDAGRHQLYCTAFVDASNEFVGYDGIIVTNRLGFTPDEDDGPSACSDSDTDFTDGACGSNWGPNTDPAPGTCLDQALTNDEPCNISGGDACCSGGCTNTGGTGTCP